MSSSIQRKQAFAEPSAASSGGALPGILRRGEARNLHDAAKAWLKARGIVGNCRYRKNRGRSPAAQ